MLEHLKKNERVPLLSTSVLVNIGLEKKASVKRGCGALYLLNIKYNILSEGRYSQIIYRGGNCINCANDGILVVLGLRGRNGSGRQLKAAGW